MSLITKRVAIVITIAIGRTIIQLFINPAMMYATNEIAATVMAYGNCVDTWLMWLHCAPAEAMIVVSEIGEQWSPQTAPARQADIPIMPSSLPTGNIEITIGIRIPNVPQEVPVANAIRQATINIIAGKKFCKEPAEVKRF